MPLRIPGWGEWNPDVDQIPNGEIPGDGNPKPEIGEDEIHRDGIPRKPRQQVPRRPTYEPPPVHISGWVIS